MRFRGQFCGKCYARKSGFQQPGLWYAIILVALIAILSVLLNLVT